ncbi:hypothetical protein PENARI_c004G01482 [Penicillium arizonense]|uniref:Amino acid transporter transmembrane domain-containing protein n=1 Tax=Penicillium arizonense TaxID=1835702 RepID=A0A1F5LRD6_PENAI|nr:hypothetical protein PENARI_c004G01482 [Penicillium arizonense]OGE55687.1 hypothetical protein PENARI_c004G01482 [Penicillium arizonense]
MAGNISITNLGLADARIDEAEVITPKQEQTTSVSHEVPPSVLHGNGTIYLDSSITFENHAYWAKRSREEVPAMTDATEKKSDLPPTGETNTADATDSWGITESEWEHAQRAVRTASWGSIFYLIATDLLGPNSVPWAFSKMGYGPGVVLYTVFGAMSCYSGLQLWKMFVGLDSTRFPMRNYGDVAFRVYGSWARIFVNVLQSFQFLMNVTLLIETNGQGLAQMAAGANQKGFLCFIVAQIIFMVIGLVLGQIRTLQRLSFLATIALWLNIVVVILTMAVVHQYPPNYSASLTSYRTPKGPIETSGYWPSDSALHDKINALMNAVFSYGGATLFNELMAEMRRPYDFWKGFIIAEAFIYSCYIIVGMVVYRAQGQFTFNPAYQGIPDSAYKYQTVGNAISFLTNAIAAILYGNIGIKVLYSSVQRDIFHFPPLDSRLGKWLWIVLVPVYWIIAWVIAAAIPQISYLGSFVDAACILQFSYTFPPLLLVGYNVQKDSILAEEEFNPQTGQAQRLDSGFQRWMRGYKKKFVWNTFDLIYALAALSTAGLGIWASVHSMTKAFKETKLTPFTCANSAG